MRPPNHSEEKVFYETETQEQDPIKDAITPDSTSIKVVQKKKNLLELQERGWRITEIGVGSNLLFHLEQLWSVNYKKKFVGEHSDHLAFFCFIWTFSDLFKRSWFASGARRVSKKLFFPSRVRDWNNYFKYFQMIIFWWQAIERPSLKFFQGFWVHYIDQSLQNSTDSGTSWRKKIPSNMANQNCYRFSLKNTESMNIQLLELIYWRCYWEHCGKISNDYAFKETTFYLYSTTLFRKLMLKSDPFIIKFKNEIRSLVIVPFYCVIKLLFFFQHPSQRFHMMHTDFGGVNLKLVVCPATNTFRPTKEDEEKQMTERTLPDFIPVIEQLGLDAHFDTTNM